MARSHAVAFVGLVKKACISISTRNGSGNAPRQSREGRRHVGSASLGDVSREELQTEKRGGGGPYDLKFWLARGGLPPRAFPCRAWLHSKACM